MTARTPAQRVDRVLAETVGKKCGKCEHVFYGARCDECNRRRARAYYHRNREARLAVSNAYRREHKEERKAYQTEYYARNRDRFAAAAKEWAAKNMERRVAYRACYHAKNRERLLEKNKEYRKENPDAKRRSEAKRRALAKSAAVSSVPKDIIDRLFALQRGKCPCCKRPLGKNYELDHIQPLALSGSHEPRNLQLLRKECNRKKSAKHPVAYMQEKGMLL